MNFLFNTVTTAASYLNPFSYLSPSGSTLSGEGGITGYNQVTIRDGSVPVDDENYNNDDTASNNREKSPSQQRPQREYFFAKHIVDETNDFRYLARRYHMGVKQEQENEGTNNNANEDQDNYNYYEHHHQFRRCKICNVEPATFFVSDLNGVFVNDNNSSVNNNNNKHNNSSSSSSNAKKTYKDVVNSANHYQSNSNIDAASPEGPQVQICFECFILAFRSMVLPELVQRDPLQTRAIAKMIQDIDEAALNDYHIPSANSTSSSSPSSGDASQNTTPNLKNNNKNSSSSPNNKYNKKLLCVRCRYPCTEDADFCPACHASTPWSIRCESCRLSARNSTFPPICPKTNQAHVLWSCEACTVTNTLDTPECSVCNTVRTWKCPRCDFGQRSRRTKSGERNCSKCGYTFSEMSTTSIRKLGLEEESVRRTDKVLHERQRTTYKIDQRMDELFDEIRDRMAEELHNAASKKSKSRSSSPSSKRTPPVVLAARLKRVEQQGDGNCAFRSISFNLFGTPNGHMLVRKAVCHGLTQRKQELLPWFENEDAFRNYVALMEQSGTWADEMALRIAAIMFGVNVHVISSDDAHWHFQFSPFAPSFAFDPEEEERQKKLTKKQLEQELKKKKEKAATRPHVFLAYTAPVHYDSLAICFEVVHPSDVSSSERRNQQQQQKSTGSFDHVSDQEDDLVHNNEDSSDNNNNNDDDEVEVLMPQPVSIPQLIAKLTKEFAQEEDQWVDVE